MTVDCFDFYLWSTGQKKIPRHTERELFKEISQDLKGIYE